MKIQDEKVNTIEKVECPEILTFFIYRTFMSSILVLNLPKLVHICDLVSLCVLRLLKLSNNRWAVKIIFGSIKICLKAKLLSVVVVVFFFISAFHRNKIYDKTRQHLLSKSFFKGI